MRPTAPAVERSRWNRSWAGVCGGCTAWTDGSPWCRRPATFAWPAGEALEAACWIDHGPSGVPQPGCSCGIYAASAPTTLTAANVISAETCVVGAIAMWGSVVEHSRGARSQFAYPARLRLVCGRCLAAGDGAVTPARAREWEGVDQRPVRSARRRFPDDPGRERCAAGAAVHVRHRPAADRTPAAGLHARPPVASSAAAVCGPDAGRCGVRRGGALVGRRLVVPTQGSRPANRRLTLQADRPRVDADENLSREISPDVSRPRDR